MNPELKSKWIEALRSGQFLQAQEVLRGAAYFPVDEGGYPFPEYEHLVDETGYCCLGVFLEIHPLVDLDEKYGKYKLSADLVSQMRDAGVLDEASDLIWPDCGHLIEDEEFPLPLIQFLGMDKQPEPTGPDIHSISIKMNDGGKTFAEIADWLEGTDF